MKPNLALRYIKASKSRTILTITGIALALALMMCIGNFFSTLTHTMVQSTKASSGDYYVRLMLDDSKKMAELRSDGRVEKSGVLRSVAFAQISEGSSQEDPFPQTISVLGYDDSMQQISPIQLENGRLPSRNGDIVLSSYAASQLGGLAVGDTLRLTTGQYDVTFNPGAYTHEPEETQETTTRRITDLSYYNLYRLQESLGYYSNNETLSFAFVDQKTNEYTVVGVMEESQPSSAYSFSNSGGTALVYSEDQNAIAAAYYRTDKGASLQGFLQDSGASLETEVALNQMLLSYEQTDYGDYYDSFPLFALITALFIFVSVIVGLAAVSIVRNTFSLTVTERLRDYGLLRCAGATPSQILKMLVQEVGFMLIIAIPLGMLLGFGASLGLVWIVNSMEFGSLPTIYLAISPLYCIISIIIGLLATFIAVVNPFRSVTRIAPVEVTRGTRQVKLPRRATRQNRLAKLVFGFEGDLSLRNMKRNGKRSRTVVASLTICVTLFICTSALLTVLSGDLQRSGAKSSVDLTVTAQEEALLDKHQPAITSQDEVLRIARDKSYTTTIGLEKEQMDPNLSESYGHIFTELSEHEIDDDTYLRAILASFHVLNSESYETLLMPHTSPSMSYDQWVASKGAIVYNYYQFQFYNNDGPQIINGWILPDLKAQDNASFYTESYENSERTGQSAPENGVLPLPSYSKNQQSVSAFLEELPWYITTDLYMPQLVFFLPEENASMLENLSVYPNGLTPQLYIDAGGGNIKQLKQNLKDLDPSLSVEDVSQYIRESNSAYVLFVLCIYGFVGIISLISCLNIINIISTNLILRRQEFGLLQAVGMSVSQVRRLVFYESLIYSLKSVFYGVLAGIALSLLFFSLASGVYITTFSFNWLTILYAAGCAFLVSLLASWPTLRRLRRMSIVDTIRSVD
ncbi:MAG: ABC transporter permease [Christensenellales bacterium]|jgi:putative ABC transport system permease protein